MAKTIKTRIYTLPDKSSGYMMLDGGPGVDCGKLHTDDLKMQVLTTLAPEYSETESYSIRDWCLHDGVFYQANSTITYDGTNPNPWDSTKWDRKEALSSVMNNIPVFYIAPVSGQDDAYEFYGPMPEWQGSSIAIIYVSKGMYGYALIAGSAYPGFETNQQVYYDVENPLFLTIETFTLNVNWTSTPTVGYHKELVPTTYSLSNMWDGDTPYAVGDKIVGWDGILRRCIVAETGTGRQWTPANWKEVKVTDLIDEIDNLVPSNASVSNQLVTQSDLSAFINGAFEVVSLTSGSNPVPDVASPSTKVIYLTKEAGSQETDPYTEWIWAAQGTDPETYAWEVIGETTPDLSVFSGSTPGLVPAATASDANKALKGDGTWGDVSTVSVSYDAVNEELHLDFSNGGN